MANTVAEVLTEHFGIAPLTLIDDVINMVNEAFYKAADALETVLNNLPPNTIRDEEIEQGLHAFETLFTSQLDRNFDAFELFCLRNIFTIPDALVPSIRLAHQRDIDFSVTAEADADADAEISRLRRQLREAKQSNARLVAMRDSLDAQAQRHQALADKLEFLRRCARAHKVQPLGETTDFMLDQVALLRQIVQRLVDAGALDALHNREAVETERQRFIDTATRHAIRDAKVHRPNDPEPDRPGGRVTAQQVQELEQAKQALEAARQPSSSA